MRTTAEILAKFEKADDMLGIVKSDLLDYLPFEYAKPFLKDGTTVEEWDEARPECTDETVKAKMLDYMPFAWEKANSERGISAMRSMLHYSAWLWLIGDDELSAAVETYNDYGKPHLRTICKKYGWDWKQWGNA
jgi:hypothetical protein